MRLAETHKQLIKFSLIGGLAVLADLSVYYLLLNLIPDGVNGIITVEVMAKTASFLTGTLVTYNLNKFWTWKQRNRSSSRLLKFFLLYGFSMLLNVGTNSLLLMLLHKMAAFEAIPFKYAVAFGGATAASAVFNFTGQKFWVFTTRHSHTARS